MIDGDKSLGAGERIEYRASLHWVIYQPVFGILLLGIVSFVVISSTPGSTGYAVLALVAASLMAPVAFVQALRERLTTEIAVTNRRVIVRVGQIRRSTMELNADKIEVVIKQTIPGRLLGYGTVRFGGTDPSIKPVSNVAYPMDLRAAVIRMSDPATA